VTLTTARSGNGWKSAAILLLLICTSPAAQTVRNTDPETPSQAQLKELYSRPLRLPALSKNGGCPVSKPDRDSVPRVGYIFCSGCPWFGKGPVYFAPAWFDETAGSVPLSKRLPSEKDRFSVKTAWVTRPEYVGPVLARIRRLEDGEKVELRFDAGGYRDLQISSPARRDDPTHWSFWPSSMLLTKPGCYGAQIDTAQGTDVAVFAVTRAKE